MKWIGAAGWSFFLCRSFGTGKDKISLRLCGE
jgi:hypothetical protein